MSCTLMIERFFKKFSFIPTGDTIKLVLSARHFGFDFDQLNDSRPFKRLDPKLASAIKNYHQRLIFRFHKHSLFLMK